MVGTEGPTIFPLGITNFVSVPNGNPPAFENSLAVADKRLFEPGYHLAGFVFGMTAFDIVVWESHVKRILARHEVDGNKVSARARVGVIIPSITVIPVLIPGTTIVGHWVIAARPLADPENCSYDANSPGIPTRSAAQACAASHQRRSREVARAIAGKHGFCRRHDDFGFDFEKRVFAELHRVLRKVCAALVLRLR